MKLKLFLFVMLVLSVSLSFMEDNSDAESVAIVELFTSEGCSSCPAADDLLEEMSAIRAREGKPFIGLSFHVTYWNRLGWIDSFSNEAFTERQKKYQALFRSQLYTPQAVVNGQRQFVGSNVIALRDTLIAVENDRSTYSIQARALRKGDSVAIAYSLNRDPRKELVNIALIEKNCQRRVTAGENKNKMLKHFNVVLEFQVMPLKREDSVTLPIAQTAGDDLEVVIYVQRKSTMKIVNAMKVSVE